MIFIVNDLLFWIFYYRLLKALFGLVSFGDSLAINALNIVNNMALDTRFKKALYDCMDTVLPSFEKLLVSTAYVKYNYIDWTLHACLLI